MKGGRTKLKEDCHRRQADRRQDRWKTGKEEKLDEMEEMEERKAKNSG